MIADALASNRIEYNRLPSVELFDNVNVDGHKGKVRVKVGELKRVKFIDKRATADMFMKKFGAYITNESPTDNTISGLKELIQELKK